MAAGGAPAPAPGDIQLTIIVPTYNEEKHIRACLDSLVANDIDFTRAELLVVDGRSTDRTRALIAEYERRCPFVRLVDNPARMKSPGVNLAIRRARGAIIVLADAHTIYDRAYVPRLLAGLDQHGAANIGGVRHTAIDRSSPLRMALSLAISHPFAAGNARYRVGAQTVREVETVFCGCFRRELVERLGGINEAFDRAEDREFNARIRAAGGRVLLDPSATCTYFPRTRLGAYVRWNAFGAFKLFYNHRFTELNLLRSRNLAPLALVCLALAAAVALAIAPALAAVLALPLLAYFVAALLVGIAAAVRWRRPAVAPALALVFVVTHFSYGLASLAGLPFYLHARLLRRRESATAPSPDPVHG